LVRILVPLYYNTIDRIPGGRQLIITAARTSNLSPFVMLPFNLLYPRGLQNFRDIYVMIVEFQCASLFKMARKSTDNYDVYCTSR
jgi:hypothetical protein